MMMRKGLHYVHEHLFTTKPDPFRIQVIQVIQA